MILLAELTNPDDDTQMFVNIDKIVWVGPSEYRDLAGTVISFGSARIVVKEHLDAALKAIALAKPAGS